MDSITQIVLGAAVGEAVGGKKLGLKASFWGAVAGTIPDLDVFITRFLHPIEATIVHRGFSHSLLFPFLFSPLFAWVLYKLYKKRYSYKLWLSLIFLAILTHPLLDVFTNYGTQLLWPIKTRYSIDSIFVVDPLYTIPFLICVIIAISLKRSSKWRNRINWIGIGYSTCYLFFGVLMKFSVLRQADDFFAQNNVKVSRKIVTSMPLTTFYWTIIGENDANYYITYKSIFKDYDPTNFQVVAKNHHLLQEIHWKENESYLKKLLLFQSDGYYTIEKNDSNFYFYDLRFGTASQLTAKQYTKPVFGYELFVDNGFVNKTMRIRNRGALTNFNFDAYINSIFNDD